MREVFKGEEFFGSEVVAVKSHQKVPPRCEVVRGYPAQIVLIRHPFATIFAEYSRKVSTAPNRHIAGVPRDVFNKTHFEETALTMAREWHMQVKARLNPQKVIERTHVLMFEDLLDRAKQVTVLKETLDFLGVCNATVEVSRCAFAKSSHPLLHRKRTAADMTLTDALTPQLMEKLWTRVEGLAARLGYTRYNWARKN